MGYKDYNDYELLAAIEEEDDIARNILYQKYKPLIQKEASDRFYALGKECSNYLALEDFIMAGQKALEDAIQKFNPHQTNLFYTFFLVCLRNKLANVLRQHYRNKKLSIVELTTNDYQIEDIEVVTSLEVDPLMCLEYKELENTLQTYMYDLNSFDRSIFELRLNGFKYKEIASLLEITSGQVTRVLQKVRNDLAKLIN